MKTLCRPTKPCTVKRWCCRFLGVESTQSQYADYSSDAGIRCPKRMSTDHYPMIPIRFVKEVEADIEQLRKAG
ncbi:hypothetical protein [uncultured Paraglaciecola sp.]|uniref:hypothetical protein n=1 Tax=uncultured Paraglaciecola sp. TaxID=1765024 RepID=UPI002632FFAB|nr:hypothetical protein [uncultured Paraglaciecola sp.]